MDIESRDVKSSGKKFMLLKLKRLKVKIVQKKMDKSLGTISQIANTQIEESWYYLTLGPSSISCTNSVDFNVI